MGHTRLTNLPRTKKWQQVIGLVGAGAAAGQIATATLDAAGQAFGRAANDGLFVDALWLLFRIPLAARSDDFADALRGCGLDVPDGPSLCDVLAGLSDSLDTLGGKGTARSDLGEIAQMAATEALSGVVSHNLGGRLFGVGVEDVQDAFAVQATRGKFGTLIRNFFARFAEKWLNYFLSRTLGQQVGEGERFRTLADQERFEASLRTHCQEAAVIVENYAGSWQSKENYDTQGDIDREAVSRFAAYAMEKLEAEFRRGGPK